MVGELFAGVGSLKAAFDIAQGLKNINDAAIRNAAVIELQEKIIVAQAAQSTLVERIGELEAEVASFESWEAQKQRYQLQRYEPGVYLFDLKPAMAEGEPPHKICPKCYEHRKRSILQSRGQDQGVERFRCHECSQEFITGIRQDRNRSLDPVDPGGGGGWASR